MSEEVKDQEEELIPVDEPLESEAPEQETEEDESSVVSEEEDNAAEDEEREKIRARRRQERKDKKAKRDLAINRDRTELDFLRKRNESLEKRISSVEKRGQHTELNSMQQHLNASLREVETAEKIIAKAVEAGEGEDVTKAMRYRDEAMRKAQQLNHVIKQRKAPQPQQKAAPQQPDPDIVTKANEFIKEHNWYNPQGQDEASGIVLAIDRSLMTEGFDPKSEDYWDELRDRVRTRLPDKFKTPSKKRQGGPSIGSGKEHAPTSSRKEVYISPDRKAALVEAGVWDDPLLRQKYIKRYMEYDRASK